MDSTDHRLKDLFATHSSNETLMTIMGYPDDQGIALNKGKIGAALAPEKIREVFQKMTPEAHWPKTPFLFDAGNITSNSQDLAAKQKVAAEKVQAHFQMSKSLLVTLGGGHDYGYPDGHGFLQHFEKGKVKPLIVNFDAHLDVRPTGAGPNSGTPFRQLIDQHKLEFDLIQVGIRPHCNSFEHRKWALDHKVQIVDRDSKDLLKALKAKVKPNKSRPLFLSVDIDSFCSSLAPGCSASWAGGLQWSEFSNCLKWLNEAFALRSLGIYEVSPPLDINQATSKLAALIIYETVRLNLPKSKALAGTRKKR